MKTLLTTDEFNALTEHEQVKYINKLAQEYNGYDWIGYSPEDECYYDIDDYVNSDREYYECEVDDLFDYALNLIDSGTLNRDQVFAD